MPPNRNFKIATVVVSSFLVILLVGVYLFTLNKQNQLKVSPSSLEYKKSDVFAALKTNNTFFAQGINEAYNGDHAKAIEYFNKSKDDAKTAHEKSVIDFNIALSSFVLNRKDGLNLFVDLSKNPEYSARMRALAMQGEYLMYAKYGDINILKQIASSYDIPWTNEGDVLYIFMKKIYSTYPLAIPAIAIVNKETENLKDKDRALLVYNRYSKAIDNSIAEFKSYKGEEGEYRSSVFSKANLMGTLNIKFGIFSKSEIEKVYEESINGNPFLNTKQKVLVGYANFESGLKDYKKAEQIIKVLLSEPLADSVKESLANRDVNRYYPYLLVLMKNTTDKDVQTFVKFLGSGTKK